MKNKKTKKCGLCGKKIANFYNAGLCFNCFTETNEPDAELFLFHCFAGHSLDCSVGMEDGGVCECSS